MRWCQVITFPGEEKEAILSTEQPLATVREYAKGGRSPNPEPNAERRTLSPRRSQAAGYCVDAKQQINEKSVSGFIVIRRRSCSPVPQESDLLRM